MCRLIVRGSLCYKNHKEGGYYNFTSDLQFAIKGDETLPTTCYGRLPISSQEDAKTIFNKIINYESTPPDIDSFYKTALHVATTEEYLFDEPVSWSKICIKHSPNSDLNFKERFFRSNECDTMEIKWKSPIHFMWRDTMFYANTPVDRRLYNPDFYEKSYPNDVLTQNAVNNSTINNDINEGVLYVNYFGHGQINRWRYCNYTTAHIEALNNGNLLPVIFDYSCLTGRYNYTSTEDKPNTWSNSDNCFAVKFLTKRNGGCVASISATDMTYFDVSNYTNMQFKMLYGQRVLCQVQIILRSV